MMAVSRILLTNDDGIGAAGLYALYLSLKEIAEVIVIAPDHERSATGHAITVFDPLRAWKVERDGNLYGFAVNGTPADCVKIGIKAILDPPPDLVVSGINLGSNMGTNLIYSGTVSAAAEGAILGVPSIAVSLDTYTDPDYGYAAKFARKLAIKVMGKRVGEGLLLNVNIPAVPEDRIKGVEITRQGRSKFDEIYDKRNDPRGRVYYWLAGEIEKIEEGPDVDATAVKNGKVSITPLHLDLTDYRWMDRLRGWSM
jgi:5'-nucleotidase